MKKHSYIPPYIIEEFADRVNCRNKSFVWAAILSLSEDEIKSALMRFLIRFDQHRASEHRPTALAPWKGKNNG